MRTSRIISGIASAVLVVGVMALGAGGVGATGAPPSAMYGAHHGQGHGQPEVLDRFEHVVVIYQEDHGFDNLYGGWHDAAGGHPGPLLSTTTRRSTTSPTTPRACPVGRTTSST